MPQDQTILIVDDEERNIRLLQAMLAPGNFRVLSAANGSEALSIVNEQPPDVILLDVMMPGLDGFGVCRRIKADERLKAIPILMVTALSEKRDWITAMDAGADDFLSKPVDRIELMVRVKSLLRMKSYHDDLQRSYEEIEEKNRRLAELEQVKEDLTHMVVHDLKNPVTAVSGTIELVLLDRHLLPAKAAEMLDRSLHYCLDIESMLRNILDIQKMKDKKLKPSCIAADLNTLVGSVLPAFDIRRTQKHIELSVAPRQPVPPVWTDPNLLERVIANLLDNAIKYSPEYGMITISVKHNPENDEVRFSIADSGPGIAQEHHDRIFDRFEQLAARNTVAISGSVGLGLSYCRMAMNVLGGRVWVESNRTGNGSTFRFALPAFHPEAGA